MKKFKKALALSLALAMGLSLVACGKDDDDDDDKEKETTASTEDTSSGSDASEEASTKEESEAKDEVATMEMTTGNGKAIHVYAWNNETGDLIKKYLYADYPELKDLVITHDCGVGGTDAEYVTKIQNAIGTDEAPAIIAADNDAAKNLMTMDFVTPLSEVGFDEACYANAYDYTVEFASVDGKLMGVTWQVTPGVVCYRTDIAEKALGFSDPEKVEEAISSWDKFFETAQKVKDAGYYMLSGMDDIKYPMLDSRKVSWVNEDGVLQFDESLDNYLDYFKKLKDEKFTKETKMWQGDWTPNMSDDVFCYFGTTWFVAFSLAIEDTDAYGKYNICAGPVPYHWGGTYLLAAKDTPNPELTAFVLYYMSCDEKHLKDQALDTTNLGMNYPNNKKVAAELIAEGAGKFEKLGGQDAFAVYDRLLGSVDLKLSTKYDNQINGYMDEAVQAYADGKIEKDGAKDYIIEKVLDNLTDVTVE